jgi:hypothetical protein
MKNKIEKFKITKLVFVLSLILITVSSCSNWIDHEINTDPDAPADVPMSLLLPAVQQSMGYNLVGNNTVRTNGMWMQQFDGVDRQSFTEARYQIKGADVNNAWVNIYTDMLMNSNLIIAKAEGSPNFEGVAQVLIATTIGITTDLWGDVPFSNAFKGSSNNLRPTYDSQERVYDTISTILDRAIVNLQNSSNVFDIDGDVVYEGDASQWIKAAYSIKARHALQLSAKNGNAAYTAALAAVANGFTSNDDDYLVPFEEANKSPFFQFMEQRTDIRMGATLVDMMKLTFDPRLPFYAAKDGDGNYTGSIAGSENTDASELGSYNASETSSSVLMSYSELKFIEAEAMLMLTQAGAQQAYEDAVAASVLSVTGNANTAWLNGNINGVPVTLETLITQKYIAGYSTNQPYADYRRTGYPSLTLAIGATAAEIPVRFPYAQNELDYNTSNVPSVQLTSKLWWDQ